MRLDRFFAGKQANPVFRRIVPRGGRFDRTKAGSGTATALQLGCRPGICLPGTLDAERSLSRHPGVCQDASFARLLHAECTSHFVYPAPMPAPAYEISWFGDRCLRLCFGEQNTPETRALVFSAYRLIESEDFEKRFSLTPAYTTLLVRFHPLAVREPERTLRTILDSPAKGAGEVEYNLIEIPVCYDADFAPDLDPVAAHAGISPAEVIRRHSSASYEVAFVGFTPGFGYLTGLPAELAAPRLPSPRTRVPAGSVGIAGDQTGIYPSATPGGWRLIGRTPLRMFDANRAEPSLLSIGNGVRFRQIDRAEFDSIQRTIEGSA